MSKCDKNCKCKKCSSDKLIIDKLRDEIRKMVRHAIDEVTVTGGIAGPSTPYAFGKRGKDIAASSFEGGKVVGNPDTGTLEEKSKDANKVVKKSNNGEKIRDVNKDDVTVLKKMKKTATTRGEKKAAGTYGAVLKLVKKKLNVK